MFEFPSVFCYRRLAGCDGECLNGVENIPTETVPGQKW